MSDPGRPGWRRLGCAALIGAALAFPLGLIVGTGEPPREHRAAAPAARSAPSPAGRNAYSPRVVSDPWVIEQQRRVVEALELSCRRYGTHCQEAAQAQQRVEEAQAAR